MEVKSIIKKYHVSTNMAEHLYQTPFIPCDLYLKNQIFIVKKLIEINPALRDDYSGADRYLRDMRKSA